MAGPACLQIPTCAFRIASRNTTLPLANARPTVASSLTNTRTSFHTCSTALSKPTSSQRATHSPSGCSFHKQIDLSCTRTLRRPFSATTSRHEQVKLTWNDFLQLRKTRRYVNLLASIGTAVGGTVITVPIMAQYEVENQIAALTGLDPFIAIGLTITAIGGTGWLLGPFVGNAVFGLWKRNLRGEISKRERDFYAHIKRYRADPTSSSVNNPVPDYYGEKIGSVADYRRWLKDQRAFNRKKNKNLL